MFQATSKPIIIYLYAKRVRAVLKDIEEKFWPSTIDSELQIIIEKRYSMVLNGILCFIVFNMGYVIGAVITPRLIGDNTSLPIPVVYPFDCTVSPVYEILYVLESICVISIPLMVWGYDFLFFDLCFTLTAQYITLHHVIEKLGSNEMTKIMRNIGFDDDEIPDNKDDVAKLFTKMFVKQHETVVK